MLGTRARSGIGNGTRTLVPLSSAFKASHSNLAELVMVSVVRKAPVVLLVQRLTYTIASTPPISERTKAVRTTSELVDGCGLKVSPTWMASSTEG